MKNSWKIAAGICCLLLSVTCLAADQWQTARGIAAKITRMQIVAHSDSVEDQELKLAVRDAAAAVVREITDGETDPYHARELIAASLPKIENAASQTVYAAGYVYPVRAALQTVVYPFRDYGTFALPAGEYTALRVIIGEGAGQNWWCVAFPGLCEPYARIDETCLSARETAFITGDAPQIRFYLAERLQALYVRIKASHPVHPSVNGR